MIGVWLNVKYRVIPVRKTDKPKTEMAICVCHYLLPTFFYFIIFTQGIQPSHILSSLSKIISFLVKN